MSNETQVDHAEVYRELDAKAKEYRGLANEALAKWQSECEHDVVEAVDCGDGWFARYQEIRVCRKCGLAEQWRGHYRIFNKREHYTAPRVSWSVAQSMVRR